MKVAALIPARSGSKGIKKKNIYPVAGKPLIAHTIEAAKKSRVIDKVIVSTDSDEIASVAETYGAEVPFRRPAKLSLDDTLMLDVVYHAAQWLKQNFKDIDYIALLQPTSPLRKHMHIDECVSLFDEEKMTSMVSVVEVPHQFHPHSVMTLGLDGALDDVVQNKTIIPLRQHKPKIFARNGPAILLTKIHTILHEHSLYGEKPHPYIMSEQDSIDIDEFGDISKAENALDVQS